MSSICLSFRCRRVDVLLKWKEDISSVVMAEFEMVKSSAEFKTKDIKDGGRDKLMCEIIKSAVLARRGGVMKMLCLGARHDGANFIGAVEAGPFCEYI